METVKYAYAAISAWLKPIGTWIDANPRKAFLAALGLGLLIGKVF